MSKNVRHCSEIFLHPDFILIIEIISLKLILIWFLLNPNKDNVTHITDAEIN